MTNILLIPRITFTATVENNSDWTDTIFIGNAFAQKLVAATITVGASGSGYTNGSQTLTVMGGAGSSAAVVTAFCANGQVVVVTGITTVGNYSILPSTSACPVSGGGGTGATLDLSFALVPLDLTGITFEMQLRPNNNPGTARVVVDASTFNGQIINSNAAGIIGFNVPLSVMRTVPPGAAYVCDIVATGDNRSINVAQGVVTVVEGITR